MDAREDRKTMAGMLQRAVATARDHSGKDCPGPDLLAAYYERSLSPAERQQWEPHFSSCGLCQAQLAALARSEPEPQLQQFWFSRWHWAWKWLPPAAVGLTAIAIWIAVHPPSVGRLEKKPLEVATSAPASPNQQDELKEAVPGASPAAPALESTGKARTSPAPVEKQQKKAVKSAVAGNLGASITAPAGGMARSEMARTAPPAAAEKTPVPPPVADKAVPAGQAGAPVEDKFKQGQVAAAVNPEMGAATPAPSPSTPARRESSSSKVRSGNAAIAPDSAWQTAGHLQVLEVRSAEVLIASPDRAVQWRIGRGGIIERTTDSGKTWSGQFVNGQPGLAAGSAPSAKICWVVGRAGMILRTKDGENWEKIVPPATIDFTGIKAKDEKTATIIAADGRGFSTDDGGKTWQAVQQDH